MAEKFAIITGASSGIGLELAKLAFAPGDRKVEIGFLNLRDFYFTKGDNAAAATTGAGATTPAERLVWEADLAALDPRPGDFAGGRRPSDVPGRLQRREPGDRRCARARPPCRRGRMG